MIVSKSRASTITFRPEIKKIEDIVVLKCVFSPDFELTDRFVVLDRSEIVIGRDVPPDGGIKIKDFLISRVHAKIVKLKGKNLFKIVDLESKNGVYINGVKKKEHTLTDGDVIKIGETLFLCLKVEKNLSLPEISVPEDVVVVNNKMKKIFYEASKIAKSNEPVLITGETGTGKDVLANFIHRCSGRKGSFVPINCSAIPESLFESTLFGHKKGAFTGASLDSTGYVEVADNGTLFLDEIGDLPLKLQPKLLRFIEDGMVYPIGSTKGKKVNTRIIAATNQDIDKMVTDRRFRGDLFARLSFVRFHLPPLRERKDEILPILLNFLKRASGKNYAYTSGFVESLLIYPWRFNVRELIKIGTHIYLNYKGRDTLDLFTLPDNVTEHYTKIQDAVSDAVSSDFKIPDREELVTVLEECRGVISKVAKRFGKDRKQIYRWLDIYGLDPDDFRR